MIIIGLTGGIASGKSTVMETLVEMGATVIDADKLGHDLLKYHSDAWHELVTAFGDNILASNGDIDRVKLGKIVFQDASALQQLNEITHPRLYQTVREKIEEFGKQQVEVVVLEAALLLESGWDKLTDQVWVTIVPKSVALQRLVKRENITSEQALVRINSQTPPQNRIGRADVVIDTSGTTSQVRAYVMKLWHNLQGEKRGHNTATPKNN
ncbi:MAG: dephospho-CoA kinase [Dehalococcoidia bacterium]|nr:dephospho-CoA kinase [Dehalococcoidia bacterium]